MRAGIQPVIKALGDDTRFQIYDWLRQQDAPACIAQIAAEFDLHPNTVRPHLDRLRDAGLVRLDASPQGSVGRPQHRYSAVHTEIELHGDTHDERDGYPALTQMLVGLCCQASVTPDQARRIGRKFGYDLGESDTSTDSTASVVANKMTHLGFELAIEPGCIAFTKCPFHDLASTYPELICALHEGVTSGLVEFKGGRLEEFHDVQCLVEPCMAVYK